MLSLLTNFIQDLKTVVMLAKVKLLFSLGNSQEELGVSLAIEEIFRSLQELDCLVNIAVLTTHTDSDESKLDRVQPH